MTTQDNAVSISHGGYMSVDTFEMNDQYTGLNDFGEPLYMFDGVEMTEDQAMQNSNFFEADDDDYGYYNGYGYADDVEDSLPEPIVDRLYQVNDALGGEGAAEFYADELLGLGEHSRLNEVMTATGQSREELQSHGDAVLIDMATAMNIPHEYMMNALRQDIATVRSMKSAAGTAELHAAISDAMAGRYEDAMHRWDRLRSAMRSIR